MSDPSSKKTSKSANVRLNQVIGKPPAEALTIYKKWLAQEEKKLKDKHQKETSGLKVARARSNVIDQLLTQLFECTVENFEKEYGPLAFSVCLLALGGYGRQELCPYSDIDIMFLYPEKVKSSQLPHFQKEFTQSILYMLWDLGFKVGHSTRNIKETLEEAKVEVQSKNAMMESRLVAGSENLFKVFRQAYTNFCKKQVQAYIQQRLKEQKERRIKQGNTVFLQEPDIKNSIGGLRDYQNILWMAQIKFATSDLQVLENKGFLRRDERKKLKTAYDFLLRARTQLHLLVKRANDLLSLDMQPKVALALGYRQRDLLKRVEAFMRDYYQNAQNIDQIANVLEQRLALGREDDNVPVSFREVIASRRAERPRIIDGFMVRGKELCALNKKVFKEDPVRLLRLFRHCQQLGVLPDPNLDSLISESIHLIDESVILSESANQTFRSILCDLGNVYPILFKMHQMGVLGRFMPEWDKLRCLVQHEYYHRYTADIHTLSTIQQLDFIFSETDQEMRLYRDVMHEHDDPAVLYLTLLLHDIGKAVGIKGHDARGVVIAGPILDRMGIDPSDQKQILFIIGHHLEMARFWQRHDIDDPLTVQSFAQQVKTLENLRLLFVHTYCDAKGTSASLWNSYKDLLHKRLYSLTRDQLTSEDSLEKELQERKIMIYEQLMCREIEGIPHEEVEAHCNLLPERYFVHNSLKEIELHMRLVNQLLLSITNADSMATLIPVIDWHDDFDRGHTVVTIVTWDRAGLFYRLAGAFSLAGLNIVSANVISRSDHISIDTFYLSDAKGGVVESRTAREHFEENLRLSLVKNKDLTPEIEKAEKQARPKGLFNKDKTMHAPIPQTVDVYHELTLQKNIIEVQAHDKIGLLYFLAKNIFEAGYDITFARIATERKIAVDTFYIESSRDTSDGPENSNLLALRDTLSKIIASDEPKAVNA